MHRFMDAAVSVTGEWEYTRGSTDGRSLGATENVVARLKPKWTPTRGVPVQLRTLEQVLRPQPLMAEVLDSLLRWIDLENDAMRAGQPKPPFQKPNGQPIFPNPTESALAMR